MKTTFKFILSLVVFVSLSTSFNTSNAKQLTASKYTSSSGITYADVYNYLIENGYTVLGITPMSNGYDWRANTVKNNIRYITIVHTDGTSIVGNEDVPM
jgi:hypothetical protein